jgi:hypothetical protein
MVEIEKLRLCPIQGKKVVCDGFCDVVFDNDVVQNAFSKRQILRG